MQTTSLGSAPHPYTLAKRLSWFLLAPVTAAVLVVLLVVGVVAAYEQQHDGRVFTGVMVGRIDVSGLTPAEAEQTLAGAFVYASDPNIELHDPGSGRVWTFSPSELGLTYDVAGTAEAAYQIGRSGNPLQRLEQRFGSWFYGRRIAPVVVLDEGRLDLALAELAAEINQPAVDAGLQFDGANVSYSTPQVGRTLDLATARENLLAILGNMQRAQIELLVHETQPQVRDSSMAAGVLQNVLSGPMVLYLEEPMEEADLQRVTLPVEEVVKWVRVQTPTDDQNGSRTEVMFDENAIRAWLGSYQERLAREPVNARFYFDDDSRDLVLVEPHVSGRELDVEATTARFIEQIQTSNHSMPFVMREIVPTVHSGATTTELGITELVSQSTTWFFGSSAERKHNIARSASNFYGIVIAPGQEFSFNHFLGEVSEEQGYETGLIIFGGRTIEGVGGGVCQVSTTVFQAAFWAGYPVVERWEHGYRVGYYDDGEGPGMDATVYAPLVDFRFINDTPYHLLIENYYHEPSSSLTFKFYSTSMGRTVTKQGPVIENVQPAKPDIWELNTELEAGEIEQVDWAVEGAHVTVTREVFNRDGDLIRQDVFVSRYIPWQNIYQYGPGTELPTPTPDPEATPDPDATPEPESTPEEP
jgi:vancomycin resistance protein YoaR